MIPILYESTEKNFTTNGLGRLKDAISCYVIEERNGTYELDMTYPVNGIHYDLLKPDRIIYAVPADGKDPQPFRIYKISKPLSGQVEVCAEHISYLLATAVVMPFTATSIVEAISRIESNIVGADNFTFWTDKSVTGEFKLEKPTECRSVLGGTSGSLLDTYGTGEYEFDKFAVKLHLHRGEDRGVTIRYGKNLSDLTAEQDISNVYTGIVPYATNQDEDGNEISVVLPEKVIKSEHTGDYAYPLYKVVDFSQRNQEGDGGTLSVDKLRTLAEAYVKNNEGWEITNSLTVSFVALWRTDEYKDIAPLERVNLCDTVHVIYTDLGVNVSAKVVKTDYDVLTERYNSIELGDTVTNLSKTLDSAIKGSTDGLADEVSGFPAVMKKAIKNASDLITGGLGGTVVIVRDANGKPIELCILEDSDDINTATKIWRWNSGGLGYSTTGYNGSYKLAMTKDGAIVADMITTGEMSANRVRLGLLTDYNGSNYWNLSTGEFSLQSTAKIGGKTAAEIAQSAVDAQTQASIFNKLTNNGATQGIYLSGGKVYINASYMATGILKDTSGNTTWNLATGALSSKKLSIASTNFTLTEAGVITAKSGTIGGFTITAKSLQSGKTGVGNDKGGGVYFGSDGLSIGNNSGWRNCPVFDVQYASGVNYASTSLLRFYNPKGTSAGNIGYDDHFDSSTEGLKLSVNTYISGHCDAYSFNKTSDARLKMDIEPIPVDESTRLIMNIRARRFRFKDKPERLHHGFIAQDLLSARSDEAIVSKGKEYYSVEYDELIADLVNVVQDQEKRISDLAKRLQKMEALYADN